MEAAFSDASIFKVLFLIIFYFLSRTYNDITYILIKYLSRTFILPTIKNITIFINWRHIIFFYISFYKRLNILSKSKNK